ncbi:glycosyltransferase family 2 protein [Cobetia sp. L2A1]|uniref:glycosyltransferase family 2 protein n=1 Tax=Cobetia sp. L2A1 TaxID=2686360 RepID=UPI00131D471D|nr:glycosyltransferase family 2 protein [Cobetia sp. L2A1]
MSKKIYRVCAIAKDEAPYLAEWVFHHHYFGFESIVVYVNRTTDTSLEVLRRLSKRVPGLEYEVIDWVDFCGPQIGSKIQTIAYAKDIARCKDLSVDYWLPLDIDEFWVPSDFKSNIHDHVLSVSNGKDAISYPWYCEIGYDLPFSVFTPESRFHFGAHVKTLSPKPWESIKRVRIHCPKYFDLKVLNPSGSEAIFQKNRPQLLEKENIVKQSAYILHRMNRSETEYFAILKKGQPKSKNDLKTNRSGYKGSKNSSRRKFNWPLLEYKNYIKARYEFMDGLSIDELVDIDKDKIKTKAGFVVERLISMSSGDAKDKLIARKLFSGTSHVNS